MATSDVVQRRSPLRLFAVMIGLSVVAQVVALLRQHSFQFQESRTIDHLASWHADGNVLDTEVNQTVVEQDTVERNSDSNNAKNDSLPASTNAKGSIAATPPPPLQQQQPTATIVVELTGEVGNNLQRIAFGRGLQLQANKKFGLHSKLVLKLKDGIPDTWKSTETRIKTCFPQLRSFDFSQGNKLDLSRARMSTIESLVHGDKPNEMERGLRLLSELAKNRTDGMDSVIVDGTAIPLPLIVVRKFAPRFFVDRFLDDYRQLFAFDTQSSSCCQERPSPDESVFHFRNFQTEIPNAHKFRGFEELSPNKTARELFQHLQPGDNVVMTTRIHNDASAAYQKALVTTRGLNVRIITNQTDMQDFCVLQLAQKELVGSAKSTFLLWAGYLGTAQRVHMYMVENMDPVTRTYVQKEVKRLSKYTNGKLKSRMHIALFQNEELEMLLGDHPEP